MNTVQRRDDGPPRNLSPTRTGPGSERSSVADLLQLIDRHAPDANPVGIDLPVFTRRLRAGENLFDEGGSVETVYFVRSGSFKTFHTVPGGYEQLLGFVGRSEMLGFDGMCMNQRPSGAVALEDSTVYVLPLRDLVAYMSGIPSFANALYRSISLTLTRQVEIADVTAAVASEVRLARFLMHLSRRHEAGGQSPRRLLLRMSRRDIASYLGVAHETVSRSFGALADRGLIRVRHREIEIIDLGALRELSHDTRRQGWSGGSRAAAPESAAIETAGVGAD